MKKTFGLFLAVMVISTSLVARIDIYENIGNAIRVGSAEEISRYFNTNVDLTIGNQEEVYSRVQAEQILKDFL